MTEVVVKSVLVVRIEVEGLGVAVDHALLLRHQKLAFFHAHHAAGRAFCDRCCRNFDLAVCNNCISHQRQTELV